MSMRKYIVVTVVLAFMLVLCLVAVACGDEEAEAPQFTVTYSAGDGGYIDGNQYQTVTGGESSTEVTARPFPGYAFVKWSDFAQRTDEFSMNPTRTDAYVGEHISVSAIFEKQVFTVEYLSTKDNDGIESGYIYNFPQQDIAYGEDAEEVTAIPFAGYVFVEWSDGVKTATRQDRDVKEDIEVYPIFIEVSQILTYEYDGATSGNSATNIVLNWGHINEAVYAVPAKEGFTFQGWFLEPEFINKVANRMGQPLMGNDVLIRNAGKLYAKWVDEDTLVYPVLMVFSTETKATLPLDDGRQIPVDYKMNEWERRVCELIPLKLQETLNEMLEGITTFEVDSYFTTEPLEKLSFSGSWGASGLRSYSVFARNVPEVGHLSPYYRSAIITFGMNDYNHILRHRAGGGSAGYATLHTEIIFGGHMLNEKSFDEAYDTYSNFEDPNWKPILGCYTHEFIHTLEMNYTRKNDPLMNTEDGEIYGYHEFNSHYLRLGYSSNESDKLYLRNEGIIDGNIEGMSHSFWIGDLDFHANYRVYYQEDYSQGGKIFADGIVGANSDTLIFQNVNYGENCVAVTATPDEGYRFVRWSDGVITATRHDVNVIKEISVSAIFERIE